MALYKKESLELLRQRVDLAEVVSGYVELQRTGASFKALCPFHEEKTPSFVIQKGDSHYHCYGCGAHGDAIGFLMSFQKLTFIEAIQALAERFGITLEEDEEGHEQKGPSKKEMRDALEKACRFYHLALLYSEEGREPLQYLYNRGLDLEFLKRFQVGYAPKGGDLTPAILRAQGISQDLLQASGLLSSRKKDFFSERITFPIRDGMGGIIGFSARKFKEETFGGKYVNTPETLLFKKSHVLFGLSYCRQKIAKEKKAIIVEGQIDALRLIQTGFDYTVAGQGTAFGEGHVRELLQLGIKRVILALDGDDAGREAALKIGDLFQKKGIEVSVLGLPDGSDPDSLLREEGPDFFADLIDNGSDYLTFFFRRIARGVDLRTPSCKAQIVEQAAEKIRGWESPVLIHESLRKLAKLAEVPEEIVGMEKTLTIPARKKEGIAFTDLHPDRILETDLLRWLLLMGESEPKLIEISRKNVVLDHFRTAACRAVYLQILAAVDLGKKLDLFSMGALLEGSEEEKLLSEILAKRVNFQKAELGLKETIQRILIRDWMEKREIIKNQIQSGKCTDQEALALAKEFDVLKKQQPEVID